MMKIPSWQCAVRADQAGSTPAVLGTTALQEKGQAGVTAAETGAASDIIVMVRVLLCLLCHVALAKKCINAT